MKIISAFHNYSFMLYFLGCEKPFMFSPNFPKDFPLPQQPTGIFQVRLLIPNQNFNGTKFDLIVK